jgi:hypothetical protein
MPATTRFDAPFIVTSIRQKLSRALSPRYRGTRGLLHLMKRAFFDLPDPLATDAKLGSKFVERDWGFGEPTCLEDFAVAIGEYCERVAERVLAGLRLITLSETGFLVGAFVYQPVLPLDGIAFVADRHVQRHIPSKTPVHVNDVLLSDAKVVGDGGNLIGVQITFLDDRQPAFSFSETKKQFSLAVRGTNLHQRPRAHKVLFYRCFYPPNGIGREPNTFARVKASDGMQKAYRAL